MSNKLLDLLAQGPVLCAEGYLFEMERRGYLQAGAFVPEVVLENPDSLMQLHKDFLLAGSDVSCAFTYYAHREKLKIIEKEHLLEPMQKEALRIAKEAADRWGNKDRTMVCGNICNTNIYNPEDSTSHKECEKMFAEQVGWAAEAGVDFILAETFSFQGEAELALKAISDAGLSAVINMVTHQDVVTRDGIPIEDSGLRLEQLGADVVGMNCNRGPFTMLPLVKKMREKLSCHVAALPVPYRTTEAEPTFFSLTDAHCHFCRPEGMRPFPVSLDAKVCTRYEMAEFARQCVEANILFVGICCGAGPHHVRSMAEAMNLHAPNSKYSPDMSKHFSLGSNEKLKEHNQDYANKL